ncbi:MAG TPA: hypothetical protein VHO70_13550, partial [Chitinispirillaceae bacterium]|nr:hypothetical protein [Chitinispirillaceae bacterium]
MKKRLPSCGFSFYSRVFVCLLVWLVIPGYSVSIVGKTYTSSNYNISSFIADHNYLWAGTNGEGLIRIDKVTGKTVLFVSTNSGIPDDYIRGLAVDTNGALIVATSKAGVVRFDGNNWEKITGTDESVRSVVTDNYGNIWAWMQSSGIVRYSAGTWQTVVNRFTGIMVSSQQGNVWFFKMPLNPTADCNDGWIQEYENGGLNTTRMLGDNCSEIEYPSCMVVDNKKNCWISSSGTLIKSTDVSFNRFEIKNDTNESRSVTALAVNHDDILLIAVSDFMEKSEIYLYDQKAASQPSFDSSTFSLDVKSIMAACYDKETGDFWCVASDGKILKIGQFKNISVFRDAVSVLP